MCRLFRFVLRNDKNKKQNKQNKKTQGRLLRPASGTLGSIDTQILLNFSDVGGPCCRPRRPPRLCPCLTRAVTKFIHYHGLKRWARGSVSLSVGSGIQDGVKDTARGEMRSSTATEGEPVLVFVDNVFHKTFGAYTPLLLRDGLALPWGAMSSSSSKPKLDLANQNGNGCASSAVRRRVMKL